MGEANTSAAKTRPPTAMAAALGEAGFDTAALRLRSHAFDALHTTHGNVERAETIFAREVGADPALIRAALAFYLRAQAEEWRAERGQSLRVNQMRDAPSDPSNGAGGHSVSDIRQTDAAAPLPGAGHSDFVTQGRHARSGTEPSAAQRAAALAVARAASVTVLDTFRVRDGRAIGDVRFGELDRLRAENVVEASVIRQIQRHAVAGHDAKVRDVIKVADLQRILQRAAEVADAS